MSFLWRDARGIISGMTQAQILKEVMAMPPRERKKFLKTLEAMGKPVDKQPSKRTAKQPGKKSRPALAKAVQWPDVLERSRKIFGDREIPNLVLLEREEYEY